MSAAFGSRRSLCIGITIKAELIVTFLQYVLVQASTDKDIITTTISDTDCRTLNQISLMSY